MLVYNSLFLITMLLVVLKVDHYGRPKLRVSPISGAEITAFKWAVIVFPLFFFAALRTSVGDTRVYIATFQTVSSSFTLDDLDTRGVLFYTLMRFCKAFLFQDPQLWLVMLTLLALIPYVKALRMFSVDVLMSVFLLFATAQFVYFFSGARQMIAIAICFYAVRYVIEKNIWKYVLLVLLAMSFHVTAAVMLIVPFVADAKPWSQKMWLFAIIAVVLVISAENIVRVFGSSILENTPYEQYVARALSRKGVTLPRALVAFVPVLLCFIYRREQEKLADRTMNVFFNISLINACWMAASTAFGGDLTGRLAEYFGTINVVLYPYIFQKLIRGRNKVAIRICFVVGYVLFYLYQMYIAWGGLNYGSDVLRLFL